MEFNLKVKMDNAAFGETEAERLHELVRILRKAATDVAQWDTEKILYDVNGNRIGEMAISD